VLGEPVHSMKYSMSRIKPVGYSLSLVAELCFNIKVNLSLCLINHDAMKTYGGVEAQLHAF
jgi:hypothetical protein